jgi:photosystem II stability/assembly factor-like uncharacterized protein
MTRRSIVLATTLTLFLSGTLASTQSPPGAAASAQSRESLLSTFKPRDIGPALMGGRVSDLAVYEADPSIFYAASASGGLLKTVNAGTSWENVFTGQSTVSIGDVAINPTDPNTVWVGTGEANNRQSSSWGDGVYKSTDGGKTWKHMGLKESHHIGRIVVNPIDTDIVYVAALGHLWGANPERGVFMTTDGGLTWKNVLVIDANTGAVDLAMDPSNPKLLYAATYQRRRTGWGFNGGGPGSGIYKTADGGRTWKKLTNGLPKGDMGRIGLDIYRKNPNIVVARVENKEGGVFRSEDKGETWTKMNSLNPRPMYFSQIRIDPNDDKRIYVGGVQLHISDDGGKTFRDDGAPFVHLDHHAFWIDPGNSNHLIDGNDGGVWVSHDRARTWEHLNNYPIGQFYNVAVDMQQPYFVYGGMQDNASWGGPSAVRDRLGIMNQHWFQMLPCDGMYAAVDPKDDGIVYTDCQDGYIVRYDRRTGERKTIRPEPAPGEEPLRWNWTAPILVSAHDSSLYLGANRLYRSTDHGHTWTAISPDLTTKTDRDALTIMDIHGKDITLSKHDGMTSFGNLTCISESPKRAGLIYVGTDDGKVQLTRDGGQNWTDLTARIPGVPKMLYVSRLIASAFDEGRVYASFDGHRSDDFAPYVYVSTDFGQTWNSIRANLPTGPVYVIKEDTRNPNLLFVGTEFGLFASLDRGATWTPWKSLQTVAVYDLVVHPRDNDLVLATHGRSIQVFDDISPLQQLSEEVLASNSHLFDIRPATEFIPNESGWFIGGREYAAPNPEFGAYINYYLKAAAKEDVRIRISDAAGKVVRELKGAKEAGLHRVAWDLRTTPAAPAAIGFYFQPDITNLGPFVLSDEYRVTLSVDGQEQSKAARVLGDPFVQMSAGDRRKLYDTLLTLTSMQTTMESIRATIARLDEQLKQMTDALKQYPEAPPAVKTAVDEATKQARDLRARAIGGGDPAAGAEGGSGAGGGRRPLRGRINGLKSYVILSQSLPTAAQERQVDQCAKDLDGLVTQVNTWITTTLPDLQKQLAANNIRPTIGELIKPVAR